MKTCCLALFLIVVAAFNKAEAASTLPCTNIGQLHEIDGYPADIGGSQAAGAET